MYQGISIEEFRDITDQKIDRERKLDLSVNIHKLKRWWWRSRLVPLANRNVELSLKEHDFLFGVNAGGFGNPGFEDMVSKLFNYITIGTFWKYCEPQKGNYDFSMQKWIGNWANDRGIVTKAHPLVYNLDVVLPDFCKTPTMDEWRVYTKAVVEALHEQIDIWEVVNEFMHEPVADAASPFFWVKAWANELGSDPTLAVNEYGPVFGHITDDYINICKGASDGNVPLDIVGVQSHVADNSVFDYDVMETNLNKFNALKEDIHITEITVHSDENIPVNNCPGHNNWSEALQAQEIEKIYRLQFANPAISAITYWAGIDGDPWRPHTGLLRTDGTQKLSYGVVDDLINSKWTTREAGRTNSRGDFNFRGFPGVYDVKLDGQIVGEVDLTSDDTHGEVRL